MTVAKHGSDRGSISCPVADKNVWSTSKKDLEYLWFVL